MLGRDSRNTSARGPPQPSGLNAGTIGPIAKWNNTFWGLYDNRVPGSDELRDSDASSLKLKVSSNLDSLAWYCLVGS